MVELPDGTFETADSYSVTKLKPGANSHKRQTHADIIQYQGDEWWSTGHRVNRGHTWYNLRNDHGEKNIILDKTYRNLQGHGTTDHPFYMPDGPYYDYNGKTWYINDMFKAGDVGYSDMVNRTDRLDHMVIRTADIMKHKIQEPKHEVHYATMGRRRLPQEGARRIPRAHSPELELEEGELREDDDFPAPTRPG